MLGSNQRFWDCMQYTDDPVWLVLGVRRTTIAIRIWHEIITGTGLMPAKASKWQIGAGVTWLGGCIYPSLGLMWVPRDKARRAIERIEGVLDGRHSATEYRELVGFLEHVMDIGKYPRELMDYLHGPMAAGGECESAPHEPLRPDGRRDGYLRKWRNILLNAPGASILAACEPAPPPKASCAVWRLRSDAMLEAHDSAMGGCCYGAWWRFPLRRPQLTIPVLELLAACVNLLVFAGVLRTARCVVMEIDAFASPTVLHRNRARAPGMKAVLAEFRRLPEVDAFLRPINRLFAAHCFGEANPLADAASRGYVDVLRDLGTALGMQMQQVAIGDAGLAFIDRVLRRVEAPSLSRSERAFDVALRQAHRRALPNNAADLRAELPEERGEGVAASAYCTSASHASAFPSPTPGAASSSPAPPHPPSPAPSPHLLAIIASGAGWSGPHPPPAAAACLAACSPPPRPRFSHSPTLSAQGETRGSMLNAAADSALQLAQTLQAEGEPWCTALIPSAAEVSVSEEQQRAALAVACLQLQPDQLDAVHAQLSLSARAAVKLARSAPSTSGSLAVRLGEGRHASAAARARAHALAEALAADTSDQGLRLEEGEADAFGMRLMELLECSAATNTLRNERSNWKHWLAFCEYRNTNPFRKDVRSMDHAAYDKEVVTLALALLFIYGRMGCKRGRRSPAKPSSALAVLRGIRRAHDRLGVRMADLQLASRLADALNREYINKYGWEALQPERVEPLTNAIIEGMLGTVRSDDHDALTTRALWATLAQTGFRKAEVSLGAGDSFSSGSLSRHSLRWRIGGVDVADPTPEQLRNLKEGDYAILIPPRSKCDQYGLEWGQSPIFLRFHPAGKARINAARELCALELAKPLHGREQREGTALFTYADGTPLRSTEVDARFKRCLADAGVASRGAKRYSPHSFRRYLACALRASGAADATIQALLRWKSPESLKLYSLLNDAAYADLVDGAAQADISSVRTSSLPRAEILDVAGSFYETRASLDAAARRAAATDPADDDPSSDADESDCATDDEAPEEAPPPPPPKRARGGRRSAPPAAGDSAAPPAPLSLDNALGRSCVVPSRIWPDEQCSELGGRGWAASVTQVERRIGAVLIKFTHARGPTGNRFRSEWLTLDSVEPA